MITIKELREYLELLNSARKKRDMYLEELLERIQDWNETHRTFITEIEKNKNSIEMLNQQIEDIEEKISDYRMREKK